jgi:BirA family biotin operon repressor/biotin-[acetyl-CoA-carboxylase] ligase
VPRWQALHAYAGEAVDLIEGGRLLQQGIARGIDEIGCLLLDTRAGRIAVLAGDISLRKQLASGTSHALAD